MDISSDTVDTHAQANYEQHRVHGRAELIRQLGATLEVALTHWRDRRADAAHAVEATRRTAGADR